MHSTDLQTLTDLLFFVFVFFFFQAESDMLDLISTYQQCLKVDTSLDDLEIKDLEEFEDSLESWDCLDGHVNGHVNSLLS